MAKGDETRDIAVEALTLVKSHMMDCTEFRKNLLEAQGRFNDSLKKIEIRMAMVLGGLIVLSHTFDFVMKLLGHG